MSRKIKVELNFINKKGFQKDVTFFMDKETYEILLDETISQEYRHQYLVNEYHELENERFFKRKYISLDEGENNRLDMIEDTGTSVEEKYYKDKQTEILKEAITKLTKRQQEMVKYIYYEGKSQSELCKIYGLKKQTINDAIKRIHNRLRKILKSYDFFK